MRRGITWLFWGFVLSIFSITVDNIPMIGMFWGALVIVRGMALVRVNAGGAPTRDLEIASRLSVAVALLCAGSVVWPGLLLLLAMQVCVILRSDRLFAYLEEAGALEGRDPATLHAQRQTALYLNIAVPACAVGASSGMQLFVIGCAIFSVAANAYQAWAMSRLKREYPL